MKEKATTQDVMAVLRGSWKIGVSESGVANAIAAVPDADPLVAAQDLVAWAEGAKGESFSAGPMLLKFMRQQVKDNPKGESATTLRECAGCPSRFHRNVLTQGRCEPCYDTWAVLVLDQHDLTIATQVRAMRPAERKAA